MHVASAGGALRRPCREASRRNSCAGYGSGVRKTVWFEMEAWTGLVGGENNDGYGIWEERGSKRRRREDGQAAGCI